MITCPFCGAENIDGADVCDDCEQSLEFLSKPQPAPGIEKQIFTDRIRALAPAAPLVVEDQTPVAEVLNLMVEYTIGCVLVAHEGKLAGIFTERDALLRLGEQAVEFGGRPVAEFMTESPETLEETDKIAFALHKMDLGGYRHLPILSDGQITGIISIRDILRYITQTILTA